MGAARLVVVVSAIAAPLFHAAVLAGADRSPWPTVCGLILGFLAWKRQTLWLAVVLGVGPVWHAVAGTAADNTAIHLLMPWLAALAAALARPPSTVWQARGPWRFGSAAWALSLALAWPITSLRELDFTTASIGAATANGVVGPSPHDSAALVALAAEAQLVALLLFDWFWGARQADRRLVWRGLMPGVLAASAVAVWQSSVDLAFMSRAPWIALNRAAGTFYDANAIGALAALFGPALATHPPLLRVSRRLWASGWLLASLAAVLASGSRASLAGWLLACTVLVVAAWRHWGLRAFAAGAVAALAIAVLITLIPPDDSPQAHGVSRLAGTVRAAVGDGDWSGVARVVWDRDGFGPTGMAMIAEHPWVGVGPGAFSIVVPDYAVEVLGFALPPDNAQNWWRHQWAELGLLGAAGAFACSLLAALAIIRAWRRRANRDELMRTAPIIALGLMSVVSPPTQHPILQVLIGLLLARGVIPEAVGGDTTSPRLAPGIPRGWLIWAAAATYATGLAVQGWTDFRPPHRAARFHFVYGYGLSLPVQTPFGDGRWVGRRAVGVFPPGGSTYVVRIVLPHDDLAVAPVRVSVSDGYHQVCELEVADQAAVECRVPVPELNWPIVRLHVGRDSAENGDPGRAALVSGHFES